ncbi:hypothetical protein [Vibrio sp. K4]|uniref:hypothetical protein n=1 Tax=Vibrio sp. K4 TaxID=3391579 RepID=UPI003DA6F772
MMKAISKTALWRNTIVEFAKELGYDHFTIGLKRDSITIHFKPRTSKLKITVELAARSLHYDIKNTQDCMDFCLLLRAIEDIKAF